MTQRHVLTADFKDIKVLEITCIGCDSKFTLPVLKGALPINVECVGCNKRLWDGTEDRAFQVASGLLQMLNQVQRHDDKKFRLGFSLNLPEKVKGITAES
jgi:hypothetical protein